MLTDPNHLAAVQENLNDYSSNGHSLPVDTNYLLPVSRKIIPPSWDNCKTMRNRQLFYEATYISPPKFTPRGRNHYSGYGYSNSNSTSGTPESVKSSIDRVKKKVQFDLCPEGSYEYCEWDNNNGQISEDEEPEPVTELERSLMQGFSEYGLDGLAKENGEKKRPDLKLHINLESTGVRGEKIDTEAPLEQQPWYFGVIHRQEAEDILRKCTEGCYIVRGYEGSRRKDYSLAIKNSSGFNHLKIHRQPDDLYRLADFRRAFLTVPDLIEYYTTESLPIPGTDHFVLLHPVRQQFL